MTFKELRERAKRQRDEENQQRLDRARNGVPPKSLREARDRVFIESVAEPRVVTCPQGIVVYAVPDRPSVRSVIRVAFDFKRIDQQIKDILAANPDADLAGDEHLQKALGVKILSVQKTKPPQPPDEGILF